MYKKILWPVTADSYIYCSVGKQYNACNILKYKDLKSTTDFEIMRLAGRISIPSTKTNNKSVQSTVKLLHRIIRSFRLEKISKIIKSNC